MTDHDESTAGPGKAPEAGDAAALRAEAQQAQDVADRAIAAAKEAAARAAQAESESSAEMPAASEVPAGPPAPVAPGVLDPAEIERIRSGYAFDGPALEMGALLDGDPRPDVPVRIPLGMLNRHGLVAGATGTGKTKTLQVLAEQLAAIGVAVFAADIKGDLSGIATAGAPNDKLLERTRGIGQDWAARATRTEYFSLGGHGRGVPIRATVAGFGPLLLSKVLGLNATQESSLGLVFHYADGAGLPLLDLADLRSVLTYLTSADGKAELAGLGGLSSATVGVILRELIAFADQGADAFFGEPEIDTTVFLGTNPDGTGVLSLLEVPGVQDQPALYSTFLMWLLADLFNDLPEVGDLDRPKLVFFFDEAHLLFKDASKDFLAQITQTVRLIRSKGVGIVFVTQTPKDVPGEVLAQLGSRVQHALRAFTPDDAKALKATVSTYPTSGYDLAEVLQTLGTGEAVVTVMNEKGAPTPVAWTRLRAPQGSMSPTPDADIDAAVAASPLLATYGQAIDRDSAREMLARKLDAAAQADLASEQAEEKAKADEAARKVAAKADADRAKVAAKADADRAKAEAKAQADHAKEDARARKAADAEYERMLKRTGTSSRRTTSRPQPGVLDQVLGSRATQQILTSVVQGIFGTRRRR